MFTFSAVSATILAAAVTLGATVPRVQASRIFSAPERERTQRFIATLTQEARDQANEKGAG